MIRPLLSGSGKFLTPLLRTHAEYARGSPAPEALEVAEPFAPVVVPTCATLAPDEPPHPDASGASPITRAIASASAVRLGCGRAPFVVRALRVTFAMSSPSRLTGLRV
jgi:hypothetical protein